MSIDDAALIIVSFWFFIVSVTLIILLLKHCDLKLYSCTNKLRNLVVLTLSI